MIPVLIQYFLDDKLESINTYVYAVPKVGESINIRFNNGKKIESEVIEVLHFITPGNKANTHAIFLITKQRETKPSLKNLEL